MRWRTRLAVSRFFFQIGVRTLARLRNMGFFGLDELNRASAGLTARLNERR